MSKPAATRPPDDSLGEAYPSVAQALWLMAAVILLQLLLSGLAELVADATGVPVDEPPTGLALVNLLAFGAVLAFGYGRTAAPLSIVFPFRRFPLRLVAPMTALILGAGIIFSEIDNFLRSFFPVPEEMAQLMSELTAADSNVWATLFLLVLVAPFTEELLFRGLFLRGFLDRHGKLTAVLASGLLFGVLHLNPWQFLATSAAGAILAWWAVETRSLWPCVFGHALNNSVPVAVSRVAGFEIPGFTSGFSGPVEFQPWWFDTLGAVAAGWGIATLVREFASLEVE